LHSLTGSRLHPAVGTFGAYPAINIHNYGLRLLMQCALKRRHHSHSPIAAYEQSSCILKRNALHIHNGNFLRLRSWAALCTTINLFNTCPVSQGDERSRTERNRKAGTLGVFYKIVWAGVLMIYTVVLNYTRRGELADIAVVDGGHVNNSEYLGRPATW